jgi:glycosyltransferase involved in cell wall biosynthesis
MRAGLFLEGLSRAFRVHVRVVPSGDPVAAARSLLATAGGRALMEAAHPLPSLAAHEPIDAMGLAAVHVMRVYLAPCVADLLERPREGRPFLSLDLDDDDASLHRQLGLDEEAERFERLAAWAVPRFDLVVDATEIPNAVDAPPAAAPTSGLRLLFVGDLAYVPNVDAAVRLCDEILPAVPSATATIVGARPSAAVRALAGRPGVRVHADVESVTPYYAAADVVVVPLAAGSGSRTKIVEAFAHRVPVVSTAVGASGLGDTDGLLLRAETAGEFAAAIERLRDDDALRTRLVDAAEEAYRRRFAFDVVAGQIASTWAGTVGAHGGR